MSEYKIIVLNLKRREDRKNNIIKLFSNVKLEKYDFYEAIDGNNIEFTLEFKNLFNGNDFGYRKGVIGCALSHYNIWLNLLADNNDYYIIFEDDISIKDNDNFINNFNKTKEYVENNIDLDVIFLGFHKSNNNLDFDNILDENINYISFDNKLFNICGAFAYIITKNGAKKIIEYIHKNGIKHGIDYLFKIIPNLNMTMIKPSIILSDWVKQLSDNVDSDIQKNFNNFNENSIIDYNNFIFCKGFDQINNDIKYLKSNSMQDLINESNNLDDLSDGFNTLGFLKTRIYKEELIKSNWFNENDGTFIKLNRTQRVKILGNWTDSKTLCNAWNKQSKGNYTWNNIKLIDDDNLIDYYIIINYPNNFQNNYIPEKTIVFQMEPSCIDRDVNWGSKTWGIWSKPDKNKFLEVASHNNTYNACEWSISDTYHKLSTDKIEKKYNYLSIICSSKKNDPGHLKRIAFLEYNDKLEDCDKIKIDIYGSVNKISPNLSTYKRYLEDFEKGDGLKPYKYYIMAENNREYNYITEKLWEPIVSECLCFYWGAPNLSDYINPLAYVAIDLDDLEGTYNIIKNAIDNDLWSQRIDIILQEKYKILNYYNFFPNVERIICKDLWKNKILSIISNTKIIILQKNINNLNHIIIPFIKTMEYFNISVSTHQLTHQLTHQSIKHIFEDNYQNYLIIEDNYSLITSINNLFNHILYLPNNYDTCYLYHSEKIIITKQYNSLYYFVKKYLFKNYGPYIVSKKGIEKILNMEENIDNSIYQCYNNINDFNLYISSYSNPLFSLTT